MINDSQSKVAWTSIRVTLVVLAFVLGLVVIIFIAGTPSSYWNEQRSLPRVYRSVPLATVIADLEASNVIPRGTSWADETLKVRPVTTRWIWPSDKEALLAVTKAARVRITYEMGHHGEIWAPVHIAPPSPAPGLVPARRQGPYRGVVVAQPAN